MQSEISLFLPIYIRKEMWLDEMYGFCSFYFVGKRNCIQGWILKATCTTMMLCNTVRDPSKIIGLNDPRQCFLLWYGSYFYWTISSIFTQICLWMMQFQCNERGCYWDMLCSLLLLLSVVLNRVLTVVQMCLKRWSNYVPRYPAFLNSGIKLSVKSLGYFFGCN